MRVGKLGWNMKWVAGVAAKVVFTEGVHFYNLTSPVVQPSQVRKDEKNKYNVHQSKHIKRAIIFLKTTIQQVFLQTFMYKVIRNAKSINFYQAGS